MDTDSGRSVPDGLAGAEAPEPPSRLGPTGGIPNAEDAAMDECIAWHEGYEAGTRVGAGYEAGYADAERDIMAWLVTPEADGANLIDAISMRLHAIAARKAA